MDRTNVGTVTKAEADLMVGWDDSPLEVGVGRQHQGDMYGYVHLFLTAKNKPREAKDNRSRYFKGSPQAGC